VRRRAALVEARVAFAGLTAQITNETEPENGFRLWWRKLPVPVLPR
jgi:hypothetical protein